MDYRSNGGMTKEEIREILLKHYEVTHGGIGERKLIITPSENCFFIELEGTPPKGYGIWIPEIKQLHLYDATGKRFKEYYLQKGISDIE